MDASRFRDLSAGIQSVVVSLAFVIGGGWALHNYISLHQEEIAVTGLAQAKKNLREQGVLELAVEGVPARVPKDSARFISVSVTAQNKGNRNMTLDFGRTPPVTVARMIFAGPKPGFGKSFQGYFFGGAVSAQKRLGTHLLRAGELYRYRTVVRVPDEAGLYLVSFDAAVSEPDRPELLGDDARWTASTYVLLE